MGNLNKTKRWIICLDCHRDTDENGKTRREEYYKIIRQAHLVEYLSFPELGLCEECLEKRIKEIKNGKAQ